MKNIVNIIGFIGLIAQALYVPSLCGFIESINIGQLE